MTLDFVIIGAEKSGTTLLVDLLRRVENVALPANEVRYFRDPFFPDRELPDLYFSEADRAKLKGIKHPYLSRPHVPERIKAHSPKAKLIAILRDPVERAIASYLHYIRHGAIPLLHPNAGIPLMFERPVRSPKYRDIIEFGNYATHLADFLKHFPRDRILVLEFEQFIRDSQAKPLFEFLGIPTPPNLAPFPRVNEGTYTWSECAFKHQAALATFIYDERMNIVGSRGTAPTVQPASHDDPLEIAAPVRQMLVEHYAPVAHDLAEAGLLTPQCWPSTIPAVT